MNDIKTLIEICNKNAGFFGTCLSVVAMIFSCIQAYIANMARNDDLLHSRLAHYNKLQEVLKDFGETIIVKSKKNNVEVYKLNEKENLIKNITNIERLRIVLNSLQTEAKYLFGDDVYNFESEFYIIIYIILKYILNENEKSNFIDSTESKINVFMEKVHKRSEIFDIYFNICVPLLEKIRRIVAKWCKNGND